jgi:hypothetical protein
MACKPRNLKLRTVSERTDLWPPQGFGLRSPTFTYTYFVFMRTFLWRRDSIKSFFLRLFLHVYNSVLVLLERSNGRRDEDCRKLCCSPYYLLGGHFLDREKNCVVSSSSSSFSFSSTSSFISSSFGRQKIEGMASFSCQSAFPSFCRFLLSS